MDCNVKITRIIDRIGNERPTMPSALSTQDRALRLLARATAGKNAEDVRLPCAGKVTIVNALIDMHNDIERYAMNRTLVLTDKALRDRLLGEGLLERGTADDIKKRSAEVTGEAAAIEGAIDLIWHEAATLILLGQWG